MEQINGSNTSIWIEIFQNTKLSELKGEFCVCIIKKRLIGKVTTNNPQINLLDLNTEFHVSYLETISLSLFTSQLNTVATLCSSSSSSTATLCANGSR